MRLCTYLARFSGDAPPGSPVAGLVRGEAVVPVRGSLAEIIAGAPIEEIGPPVPLSEVLLHTPHRPGKILGVGLNYRAHAAETGKPVPTEPLLFAKLTSAAAAPFGEIACPAYAAELDYEGELAVVIGRAARDVPLERALDHVFGYAIMNDVSARDRQRAEPQWVRAKGGDGFAPFGPWITTADEVGDPQALRIRTWVDDELRQDGETSDMVFSVAELIAWISASFTLEPGDVIATGTPSGVGAGFDPPRFLSAGSRVRIAIDGLGEIAQTVTA